MEKKDKKMIVKFLWGVLYIILLGFYGLFYSIHFISNFISIKLKDWVVRIEGK
jgi:hypothetical protein